MKHLSDFAKCVTSKHQTDSQRLLTQGENVELFYEKVVQTVT